MEMYDFMEMYVKLTALAWLWALTRDFLYMLGVLCPTYQKPDVLQKVKVFDIHTEIPMILELCKYGKVVRERVITVGHHLL